MKNLVVAGLAMGALVAPAVAADMPVKAPPSALFSWTGFYIGANAGWGTLRDEDAPYCIDPAGVVMEKAAAAFSAARSGGTVSSAAAKPAISGSPAGGLSASRRISRVRMSAVRTSSQAHSVSSAPSTFPPLLPSPPGEKLSWLGTTRGRLGLAFDHLLLYATGGVAYGEASVNQDLVFPTTPVAFPSSASATMTGWTAGGGLEYAFLGNWSAKFEGMFYDLGTITTAGVASPHINNFVEGKAFKVEGAVARVGVNWRFGGLGWYGL